MHWGWIVWTKLMGFSFKPPEFLIQAAKDALDRVECNQYSHTRGRPRLRQALADAYSPFFGRKLNPDTVPALRKSLVTVGNRGYSGGK